MKKGVNNINIIILGISYINGMAGSRRIQNWVNNLKHNKNIIINNLIIAHPLEKDLIGESGTLDKVKYKIIGYKLNILSIYLYFSEGIYFLKHNKEASHKNILYVYGHPELYNIIFVLYAKLTGFKIIVDIVEDLALIDQFPNLGKKIKNLFSKFIFKQMHFFTDVVLTVSKYLFNKTKQVSKNKFEVYHFPISVDFKYFNGEINKKSNDEISVFYGGSFGEKDGVELIIEAFSILCKKYNNLKLILSGKGSKRDLNKIFKYIEGSGVTEKIIYLGFIDNETYYKTLHSSDIFCMNRIDSAYANAGFPFKVGEYLATGKAVIVTNVGDIPLYFQDQVNGLVIPPNSVNALANSIEYLIKNPNRINEIGSEGYKMAKLHFDAKILSNQLYNIFNSL